jgi:glycosyltransferase involved in cell wall biosynthesis
LGRFGLNPRQYVLFVGRLVPENCAHHLVDAFSAMDTDMRCVIVGDAPYQAAYVRSLRSTSDPRVVFTGYLFGPGYEELCSNAYLFVETSQVGGTHPALVEAMGLGNCVVVNDTPENMETIGEAGLSYDGSRGAVALREVLGCLIAEPETAEVYRARASERTRDQYDWEAVTDQYEDVFRSLAGHPV